MTDKLDPYIGPITARDGKSLQFDAFRTLPGNLQHLPAPKSRCMKTVSRCNANFSMVFAHGWAPALRAGAHPCGITVKRLALQRLTVFMQRLSWGREVL